MSPESEINFLGGMVAFLLLCLFVAMLAILYLRDRVAILESSNDWNKADAERLRAQLKSKEHLRATWPSVNSTRRGAKPHD
jgi:hypothetical protein